MQPSTFNPWTWRDPSALAGGYSGASPDSAPPDGPEPGGDGTRRPRPRHRRSTWSATSVEATDGRIGSVDEASDDTDARWLVVDTGPWIFAAARSCCRPAL